MHIAIGIKIGDSPSQGNGGGDPTPGAFDYLRPDGTSYYLRPGGTDYYLRP